MVKIPAPVREYAEETGVFAFSVFRNGRLSSVETLFWMLCVAFFGGLTISDLVHLTASFLRQDVNTVASRNTPSAISFDPSPTFALSYVVDSFKFEHINDTYLEHLIDSFVSDLNNSDVAVVPEMYYDLLNLTVLMLQHMIQDEKDAANRTRASSSVAIQKHSLVDRAYDLYHAKRVNFTWLMLIAAAQICSLSELVIYTEHDKQKVGEISPCRPQDVVYMDPEYVSVRLPIGAFVFSNTADRLLLSWRGAVAPDLGYQAVYFDLTGTPMTNVEHIDSDATWQFFYQVGGERIALYVRIAAAYQRAAERTLVPCAPRASNMYECKQLCRIAEFNQSCACFPLAYAAAFKTPDDVSDCASRNTSLADYLGHCEKSDRCNVTDACFRECLQNCYTRTFVATTDRTFCVNSSTEPCFFELAVSISTFEFPLFEEKLVTSWATFMSQFGGILGLYLGISFAGIVHIPVFLLRKLIEQLLSLSKRKGPEHPWLNAVAESAFTVGVLAHPRTSMPTDGVYSEIRRSLVVDDLLKRFDAMQEIVATTCSRLDKLEVAKRRKSAVM